MPDGRSSASNARVNCAMISSDDRASAATGRWRPSGAWYCGWSCSEAYAAGRPWKLRAGIALLAVAVLAGCPVRAPLPAARPAVAAPAPAARLGTPYEIVPGESQLLILVYRGGALASAGHNHLIASHDLGGTFYVPADPLQASFELTIPVASSPWTRSRCAAPSTARTFRPASRTPRAPAPGSTCSGPPSSMAQHSPQIVLRAVQARAGTAGRPGRAAGARAGERARQRASAGGAGALRTRRRIP